MSLAKILSAPLSLDAVEVVELRIDEYKTQRNQMIKPMMELASKWLTSSAVGFAVVTSESVSGGLKL